MRPYYIAVAGILPIVCFAVAAPLPVQENSKTDFDVAQIPEDVKTMLGKRAGEMDDLFKEVLGHPESHFFSEPEELSAALPSSSSQLLGPTGGSMDLEKPLPSVHEESLRVLRLGHQPPITGGEWIKSVLPLESGESSVAPPSSDYVRLLQYIHGIPPSVFSLAHLPPSLGPEWNKMWDNMIETHFPSKPEEPPDAHPPSSSRPSGPADGSMNAKEPLRLPFIFKEPSLVSSPGHALQIPGYEPNKLPLNHFRHPGGYFLSKPKDSSATHLDSSSTLQMPGPGPASGSTSSKIPAPPVHKEALPVLSQGHLPPSLGVEWNKMLEKPPSSIPEDTSLVSSPDYLVSSPESWTDAGYELMKGDAAGPSGPTSSTMSSAGHELIGAHAMPHPRPSIESGHEMAWVPPPPDSASTIESDYGTMAPPSGPVSTNPEGQWMGVGSSSGKRKRP